MFQNPLSYGNVCVPVWKEGTEAVARQRSSLALESLTLTCSQASNQALRGAEGTVEPKPWEGPSPGKPSEASTYSLPGTLRAAGAS